MATAYDTEIAEACAAARAALSWLDLDVTVLSDALATADRWLDTPPDALQAADTQVALWLRDIDTSELQHVDVQLAANAVRYAIRAAVEAARAEEARRRLEAAAGRPSMSAPFWSRTVHDAPARIAHAVAEAIAAATAIETMVTAWRAHK